MGVAMTIHSKLLTLRRALAGLALFASPALADPQSLPVPVPTSLRPILSEAPPVPLKPALWIVSDDDTTI